MKFDAIVLGCGAAGYYFAMQSAKKNKKIMIVENDILGGTAFSTGCLPVKKYMDNIKLVKRAEFGHEKGFLNIDVNLDRLFEISKLETKAYPEFLKNQLEKTGVIVKFGEANILNKHEILLDDIVYSADNIVIATGTSPSGFGQIQIDGEYIISHKELLFQKEIPAELIILGANIEGIEFASLFSELGTNITLIDKENQILVGTDRDFADKVSTRLKGNGVKYMLGSEVANIEKQIQGVKVTFTDGSEIEGEKILITGVRKANIPVSNILFEKNELGYLKVNKNFETSIKDIYAIGDINGIHGMAHIAIQQGIMLSDYIWGGFEIRKDYEKLPRCIFTLDEIAGVGIQADEAVDAEIKICKLSDVLRTRDTEHKDGMVKIVLKEKQVVGIWLQCIDAGNIMSSSGLMLNEALTLENMKNNLWIHPTILEGCMDALIGEF